MDGRKVVSAFQKNGLSLHADACREVQKVVNLDKEQEKSLNLIIEEVKLRIAQRIITQTIINLETIKSVVAELSRPQKDLREDNLETFDAFNSPRIFFDELNKSYSITSTKGCKRIVSGESRSKMYRERLIHAEGRLLRSGLFERRKLGAENTLNEGKEKLSTIIGLLGLNDPNPKVLLGMITDPAEIWCLEDLTGYIKLDLSKALTSERYFSLGFVVVVRGELVPGKDRENDVFRVQSIELPPTEDRERALDAMRINDPYLPHLRLEDRKEMLKIEERTTESMFVILSDVKLDYAHVLEKLQRLFEGFERGDCNPLFILMGTFVSKDSPGRMETVTAGFSALADIIASCPRLAANAKFLIIPGQLDGLASKIFPRSGLPLNFTKELREKVTDITFGSNPCRLRFFTQEIVLFREDFFKAMHQTGVFPRRKDIDEDIVTVKLVESIIEQAHLFPLPATCKPIWWEFDCTLRLTPLPHLLVYADNGQDQYEHDLQGCKVVNPGSFWSTGRFQVYRPATKKIENSIIPDLA